MCVSYLLCFSADTGPNCSSGCLMSCWGETEQDCQSCEFPLQKLWLVWLKSSWMSLLGCFHPKWPVVIVSRAARDVKAPSPMTAATRSVLLDAPDPKTRTVWSVTNMLSCVVCVPLVHSSTFLQACRHFNDSGVCKANCPLPTIYDPVTFQSKPNPDRKFSFGATCVKTCPCENHYLKLRYVNSLLSTVPNISFLCFVKNPIVREPLFKEDVCRFVWTFVSSSVDNYLAMDVACTLNYPKPNQEEVISQPCGNDTQKCYKCEGDCPKGRIFRKVVYHLIFIATKAVH